MSRAFDPQADAMIGQTLPDRALLENAQAHLAAIVRASSDAIISKTLDSTVTSWNAAAARIFGFSEVEMLGQSMRRIIPDHLQPEEDMILAKIAAGERLEHYETVRVRKDGQLIDVSVTVSPLYDTAGHVVGASNIARDVTERNFAERRLAAIREALSAERQESEPNELVETEVLVPSGQTAAEREAAIAAAGVLPFAADRAFEQVARLASGVIQSPTALLTIISAGRQVFLGAYGLPPSLRDAREIPADLSYCRLVVESGKPVSIRNAAVNPLVSKTMMWRDGLVSYLGVPIFDRHGVTIGALSVTDAKPRAWTLHDLLTLKGVAQQVMRELENRAVLQTLAESEERLRKASTAAGFGIHDTRIGRSSSRTTWSAELARMLGLGSREMIVPGLDTMAAFVHPSDRARVTRVLDAVLRRPGNYDYECRVSGRDGKVRWILDRGEATGPVDPDTGLVTRITGVVLDITERKNHEEKVLLLMREVNHRAKNMLGLVQAMARQTVATRPADFLARFSDRIQALSANQDLLVKNEWDGVELSELVQAQLATFADLIGVRIRIAGPEVRLTAAAAQGIGLALHELCTNAGKYGALANETGEVTVSWRREGDCFELAWLERGGPPVSPPAQKGFGSTIITHAAETSVDGKAELDYAPGGVRWTLTAAAGNVMDTAMVGAPRVTA
jgi:PAS domain S-box-containing protein